jgi:membrane fusion protein, adhesin transport system
MAVAFSRTTRSLAADSARPALFTWLVAAVLLVLWLVWFIAGRVTVYEVSRAARLEVQQAARPVSILVSGRLLQVNVALGQQVRRGDLMFEFDSSTETLRLREEQARLEALPPRLDALGAERALREQGLGEDGKSALAAVQTARFRLQEAEAAVAFARETERRVKEESSLGSVARVEAERAASDTLRLVAARDALAADVRRLESDAQNRGHVQQAQLLDLLRQQSELQGERAMLEASVARLQLDIEHLMLRAPVDGRVAELAPLKAGAVVAAGQSLATVVPAGELLIAAEFDPPAVLGRLRAGQKARLRLDGFPWAQYGTVEARVVRVASEIRDQRVHVELAPVATALPGLTMQHGLPGSVEVDVEEVSPAVLVLRAAGQSLAMRSAP